MVPPSIVPGTQKPFSGGSHVVRVPRKERLPRVVCVEWQSDLLERRALFLQALGCVVRSAVPSDLSALVRSAFYRVAVFGQTLSHAEAAEWAVRTKALSPDTKLVLVTGAEPPPRIVESLFHAIVPEGEGPAALAMCVRLLLTGVRERRS